MWRGGMSVCALVAGLAVSMPMAATATAQATVLYDATNAEGAPGVTQSYSVNPGDWNADGYNDHVLFVQHSGGPALLYRILSDGSLALVQQLDRKVANQWGQTTTTQVDRHTCRWGDFNHDAHQDAYCTLGASNSGPAKTNELWLGQTGGTLSLAPAITSPVSGTADYAMGAGDPWGRGRGVAVADYNGDGWLDLFVTNDHPRGDGRSTADRLFLNRGNDPITGQWLGFADAPSWGVDNEEGDRGCDFSTDFNHDSLPDIVFCGSSTITFYQNTGTGFVNVTKAEIGANSFASDATIAKANGRSALVYIRNGQWGIRYQNTDGTFGGYAITHPLTYGRAIAVAPTGIYVLEGNGLPGCQDSDPTKASYCPTNYPDYFYPQWNGQLGPPITLTGQTGHGDDVVALGPAKLWVTNGADLDTGPSQIYLVQK